MVRIWACYNVLALELLSSAKIIFGEVKINFIFAKGKLAIFPDLVITVLVWGLCPSVLQEI